MNLTQQKKIIFTALGVLAVVVIGLLIFISQRTYSLELSANTDIDHIEVNGEPLAYKPGLKIQSKTKVVKLVVKKAGYEDFFASIDTGKVPSKKYEIRLTKAVAPPSEVGLTIEETPPQTQTGGDDPEQVLNQNLVLDINRALGNDINDLLRNELGELSVTPVTGQYFENETWVAIVVRPISVQVSTEQGMLVLKRGQSSNSIVLGPGTSFPTDAVAPLPDSVENYIRSKGFVIE